MGALDADAGFVIVLIIYAAQGLEPTLIRLGLLFFARGWSYIRLAADVVLIYYLVKLKLFITLPLLLLDYYLIDNLKVWDRDRKS